MNGTPSSASGIAARARFVRLQSHECDIDTVRAFAAHGQPIARVFYRVDVDAGAVLVCFVGIAIYEIVNMNLRQRCLPATTLCPGSLLRSIDRNAVGLRAASSPATGAIELRVGVFL